MKKWMSVVLMLVLMLVACSAAAQVTISAYSEIDHDNIDFVEGTNLLRMRMKNGYALCDLNGQALTQEGYDSFRFDEGYIIAKLYSDQINRCGLLALDGSIVLPMTYGDVEMVGENWAIGYTLKDATADHFDYETWGDPAKYYLIDKVDVYFLPEKKLAGTLGRENFSDANDAGYNINIENRATGKAVCYDKDMNIVGEDLYSVYSDDYAVYDVQSFYENRRYGLKDAQGNVILKPTYDLIYSFYGDMAKVETAGKYGVIDKTGKELLAPAYDDIVSSYQGESAVNPDSTTLGIYDYYGVEIDGKFAYVNGAGEMTFQPKYAESVVDNQGVSATLEDMEGKFHILAADGVETVVEGYQRVSSLYFSGGMMLRVTNKDYDYGVIDWHGAQILPCEYDDIALSGDGKYLLAQKNNKTVIYAVSTDLDASDNDASVSVAALETAPVPAKQESAGAQSNVKSGKAAAKNAAKGKGSAAEATAQPAPAATEEPIAQTQPDAPQENSAVIVLLDNAVMLLNADPVGSGAAAKGLIVSAATLLAGVNDAAVGMLNSAAMLLDVDAAANAVSVITLINTAKTML